MSISFPLGQVFADSARGPEKPSAAALHEAGAAAGRT
jgi:hypothetical protein